MNIRRSIATVGAASAITAGSLFIASPAQAAPVITGGVVNVTIVDLLDADNNRVLQNVAVGVAANVMANVCGVQVGAQVVSILTGLAQGQDVSCVNDDGTAAVEIDQVGG